MWVNLSSIFQSAVYILLLGAGHHRGIVFAHCMGQRTWPTKVYGLTNPGWLAKEFLVREGNESGKIVIN